MRTYRVVVPQFPSGGKVLDFTDRREAEAFLFEQSTYNVDKKMRAYLVINDPPTQRRTA